MLSSSSSRLAVGLVRQFSSTNAHYQINNLVVVGGGLMGSGIAQVAAQAGNKVSLVDLNDTVLTKSKASISGSLTRVAKKQFKDDPGKADSFVKDILGRLTFTPDLNNAVKDADLVIEAIVENLDAKKKLFGGIDKVAKASTIFASNTSSIPISEIAAESTRKPQFAGLHFFNPVPVMKLLEIIRIQETSDETYEKLVAWGKHIGKATVVCKDTPGFIVNRLLIPYMMEAVSLLERGDANSRDIDTAMKLGAGYPMGPFELADYVGLDTLYHISQGWEKRFPNNPSFRTPETIKKLYQAGKYGIKSGAGFYDYPKK
jgi:3-hydroxyacyl-CoA dehydrogenase